MDSPNRIHLLGLVGSFVLVIAACGGSDSTVTTAADATGPPSTEAGATSEDMVAEEDMATNEDMALDEHDHATDAIAWDGPVIPALDVVVTGDPEVGWDIVAETSGFEFSSPDRTEHVPGEGHTHVYVDGRLVAMSYEPVVQVADLEPGEHQAMVTLSRNDHIDYSIDGDLIMATVTFTVPGDVQAADANLTVMYMGGEVSGVDGRPEVTSGDVVEIEVHSDVADQVHVHGYDLFLDLDGVEPGELRFTADIPGIFEVELEDGGVLLFEFIVR